MAGIVVRRVLSAMKYVVSQTVEIIDLAPVEIRAGLDNQPTTDWVPVLDTPMWALPLRGEHVKAIRLMHDDGSYLECRELER